MNVSITSHAAGRMQNRSIPITAIDMLLAFGSSRRSRGAESFYFDHAARRRAAAALDATTLRQSEKYLNAYAVVSNDGALITAAWRNRRRRSASRSTSHNKGKECAL
jgi:hypothetical protein